MAKQKKCSECEKVFIPKMTLQKQCGWGCALKAAKQQTPKHNGKVVKAIQSARKQNLKSRTDWLRETQTAFNKYIRTRDKGKPCICCGENNDSDYGWDCGHFKSIGSHPELRYELTNAHRQLSSCNRGAAKYRTNERTTSARYEENLIKRIGQEEVDWLNGKHEAKHYTIDDLKELKALFKSLTNELLTGGK